MVNRIKEMSNEADLIAAQRKGFTEGFTAGAIFTLSIAAIVLFVVLTQVWS